MSTTSEEEYFFIIIIRASAINQSIGYSVTRDVILDNRYRKKVQIYQTREYTFRGQLDEM